MASARNGGGGVWQNKAGGGGNIKMIAYGKQLSGIRTNRRASARERQHVSSMA